MSRIGKMPIAVPQGVTVTIGSGEVTVKGAKGELSSPLLNGISAQLEGDQLTFSCVDLDNQSMKANYGLVRSLAANNVLGVTRGFEKILELRGVGYRAQLNGKVLNLALGFSHPVEYPVPDDLEIKVEKSLVTVSGADKQRVGQVAAEIRAYRPPEPYKGKGVRYVNERVVMKEGKKA
ncbi:MAG: 50S ribosomal protein L6 [Mariprofundaceae bacterium]